MFKRAVPLSYQPNVYGLVTLPVTVMRADDLSLRPRVDVFCLSRLTFLFLGAFRGVTLQLGLFTRLISNCSTSFLDKTALLDTFRPYHVFKLL